VSLASIPVSQADEVWDAIWQTAEPLTPEILDKYKKVRPKQKRTPTPDEPSVPDVVPPPKTLTTLRDAVEAGAVQPEEFQAFWVEVGKPSGGSGSQLELPRTAQRFFGFDFDEYDSKHHTIGMVPIITPSKEVFSCPLTWHGNNKMERMNLPTPAKSGLTYANRIVLFQREAKGFRLVVETLTSKRSQRWRDESLASASVFRFGPNSTRTCGLI
jgi:hypothetical protein